MEEHNQHQDNFFSRAGANMFDDENQEGYEEDGGEAFNMNQSQDEHDQPFDMAQRGMANRGGFGQSEEYEEDRLSLVNPPTTHANFKPKSTESPNAPKIDISMNLIKENSYPNLNLPALRSHFPLSDRFALSLTQCCGAKQSPRSELRNQKPLFKFEDHLANRSKDALKLKILETGSLVLDHHMIHPFVRVHVINLDTCKYLAKEDRSKPSVANIESADYMDANKNHTDSAADFLLPLSTSMYDLRVKGMNLAQWNEEFVINECAKYLLQPNIIFLFEILDFNTSMLFESPELLNADNLYPIAWAYLRPVGAAQIHLAKTRLQLFKYKFRYDSEIKRSKLLDVRTPPVFLEFNWPRKEQYPSFLEVELLFTKKPDIILLRKHISRFPWEKEVGRLTFENIASKIKQKQQLQRKELADNEPMSKKQLLKRWERFPGFPSELPDMKLWKFDTEALGSLKIQFSHSGRLLAVACTTHLQSKTLIKVYDVENGEIRAVLRGHHDLIHDLQWSPNDDYLLSTSADCSAKIWNLSSLKDSSNDAYTDKLNYTENDSKYFVC